MTLRNLFGLMMRRAWTIILVAVLFCGAAVALSLLQTPKYEASVTILIGQDEGITQSPNEAVGLQQLTQTMATAADSRRVYEPVVEEFNLDVSPEEFEDRFDVQQVSASQFVEISYTDTDPETARQVANALGEEFSNQIDEISENSNQVTATVWNEADTPTEPVSPKPVRNGILALLFGGVLGVGLAFVLEFFDDSWSSPEEAEQISGVPTFGTIPDFQAVSKRESGARSGRKRSKEKNEKHSEPASTRLTSDGPRSADRKKPAILPTMSDSDWPFGVVIISEEGKLVDSNRAFREMLGLSENEMKDKSFAELASHPDDIEEQVRLASELKSGESDQYQIEKRLIKKSGEVIWVWIAVSRNNDDRDGATLTGMVQEVTAQKQVQEQLKLAREAEHLSQERLRAVVETSSLSVHSFTPEGDIVVGKEAWAELWGIQAEAPEEFNVFESSASKESGLVKFIRESLKKREPLTTTALKVPDSSERSDESNGDHGANGIAQWIQARIHPVLDDSGRVVEVWMAIDDVTFERKKERQLETIQIEREEISELLRRTKAEQEKSEHELKEFRERFKALMKSIDGNGGDPR